MGHCHEWNCTFILIKRIKAEAIVTQKQIAQFRDNDNFYWLLPYLDFIMPVFGNIKAFNDLKASDGSQKINGTFDN